MSHTNPDFYTGRLSEEELSKNFHYINKPDEKDASITTTDTIKKITATQKGRP